MQREQCINLKGKHKPKPITNYQDIQVEKFILNKFSDSK